MSDETDGIGPSDAIAEPDPYSLELTKDEQTMAMLAHLLGVLGFLGPLIIMLVKGQDSKYVNYHATQSLLLVAAFTIFAIVIQVFTCGFGALLVLPLLPFMWGFQIYWGIRANNGEWVGYPGISDYGRP